MIHISFLVAVSILATVGLAREPQEGFNYNMILPVGSGDVTEANPYDPPGIIAPDAPADSALGKIRKACVGGSAQNKGEIRGVDIIYAVGDDRNSEYCITGFSGHGCIGDYAYVNTYQLPKDEKPDFAYYQHSLDRNYDYTAYPEYFECHRFDIEPLPKAITIERGRCPGE